MFLSVADDVKNGKRPQHLEAISAKEDFYAWVSQRIDVLLAKVQQEQEEAIEQQALVSYLQS